MNYFQKIGLLIVSGWLGTLTVSGFDGEKTGWHGFDRYDYVMDAESLAVTPFKAAPDEGDGVKAPADGQRRCIIVAPRQAAAGKPWVWRGCYWNHEPQTEMELLKRGFHVAYISADAKLKPDQTWEAWHKWLVEKNGLSPKPAFVGMSRGGEYAFTWAARHPGQTAAIYADNPGFNDEAFAGLKNLAANGVPLLLVCGSLDPLLGRFALAVEAIYQQYGGRVSLIVKEGAGHHPHSLPDARPLADFIAQSVAEKNAAPPKFVSDKFTKGWYYAADSQRRYADEQRQYLASRGARFSECYERYEFMLPGVEGFSTVIVPNKPAPGKPWVLRADFTRRDDATAQELLVLGFYIVTGPVPYNADGPRLADWNALHRHLTASGLAKKPVLLGDSGAAGEALAWAAANPDKVSRVCVTNPLLHSFMAQVRPLDNLEPLARAKVPLMVAGDEQQLWHKENGAELARRYGELGAPLTISDDEAAAVEFIAAGK